MLEPKTRARDARSTVGQIAEEAKVSHHKAAQAVTVGKVAPDLLEQVAKGEVKLKDAAAKVKAAKAAQRQGSSAMQKTNGKRQQILRNATKLKMIVCLSRARGIYRGLTQCDVANATAAMTWEELKSIKDLACQVARDARAIARKLEAVRQ